MLELKDGTHKIFFVADTSSSLRDVLIASGFGKSDGSPKEGVHINAYAYYNSIPSIEVRFGSEQAFIVNDAIEFQYDGVQILSEKLRLFYDRYKIKVGPTVYPGGWIRISENTVQNEIRQKISVSTMDENKEDAFLLNEFVHTLRKNNGNIVKPLANKFSRILQSVGIAKYSLLGYVHLPTYFNMIRSNVEAKKLISYLHQDKSDLTLRVNPNRTFRLKVVAIEDNLPVIEFISEGITLKSTPAGRKEPYLLLSAKPTVFAGSVLPFFPITQSEGTIFGSVLMFDSNEKLSKTKGGVDLLK